MSRYLKSLRACLGGAALGLGSIGIFIFAVGMLADVVFASFLPGTDGRTFEQIQAAEDHAFWQNFIGWLLPLLVISIGLIGYGHHEALNEKKGT